jgi:hypothetical protein
VLLVIVKTPFEGLGYTKIELVEMFGQEVADKMIENATKLVPMLYNLKVKKVVKKKAKEVVNPS